jgi:mRNA interferase MazF
MRGAIPHEGLAKVEKWGFCKTEQLAVLEVNRTSVKKLCSVRAVATEKRSPNYIKERKFIHMNRVIKRGEVYFANLNPYTGSEQGGIRPVLVVQNDMGNKSSPTTIIAPISNKPIRKNLPVHVSLSGCNCLDPTSIVLAEQIRVIDKSRLMGFVCPLTIEEMEQINNALLVSLGISKGAMK